MTTHPPGEPRLFNPDTLKRRRRTRTVALWFGVLIIAIIAQSVLSSPSLAPGMGFLVLSVAGGVLVVLALRARAHKGPQPTITCAACGASGWIEDVRKAGGRCPLCGHDRFHAIGVHRRRGATESESGSATDDAVLMATAVAVPAGALLISGQDLVSGDFAVEGDSGSGDGGGGDGGEGSGDGSGDGGGGDGGGGE